MALILCIFLTDLEIRFLIENLAEMWSGVFLQREWAASMTSWSPCYIETFTERFWVIGFIIHDVISEKKGRDLVRKKNLKFCQTLPPRSVKIQWFLKFLFKIPFSIVQRFLKSNSIVILNIKTNLLFLAMMTWKMSVDFSFQKV